MSDPKKNVCNLHSARDTRKEEEEEGAEMDAVKRGEEWDGGPVRRKTQNSEGPAWPGWHTLRLLY